MFVTSEAEWRQLVIGQREGQTLDFKSGVTPKKDELALDVATFANADGGLLAYEAVEEEHEGVRVAVATRDIGPTEPHVTLIEDAIHTHLYGIDPKPDLVPLRVGTDRVLAVNVHPSARLVGFHNTAERERVRYPVRVGTDRRYLRPDEVERRTLAFPARAMQLQLTSLLGSKPLPSPARVFDLTHIAGANGGEPRPWRHGDVEVVQLNAWGVVLRFTDARVKTKVAEFEVPYDWIITIWNADGRDPKANTAEPYRVPALLVSATLSVHGDGEHAAVDGVPMPWGPRRRR